MRLPNNTGLLVGADNTAHLARFDPYPDAVCGWWRAGARRMTLVQAHVYIKPGWCRGCFPHGNPT